MILKASTDIQNRFGVLNLKGLMRGEVSAQLPQVFMISVTVTWFQALKSFA